MARRIDSSLLYNLLKITRKNRSVEDICGELYISGGSANRFKNGESGKCWWPRHTDWYYNMVQYCSEGEKDDVLEEKQELPLEGGEVISERRKLTRGTERWKVVPHRLTFETHVFRKIKSELEKLCGEDGEKQKEMLLTLCRENDILPSLLRKLAEQETADEMIKYLITSAKTAKGKVSECTENDLLEEEKLTPRKKELKAEEEVLDVTGSVPMGEGPAARALCLRDLQVLLTGQPAYWLQTLVRWSSDPAEGIPVPLSLGRVMFPFADDGAFLQAVLPAPVLQSLRGWKKEGRLSADFMENGLGELSWQLCRDFAMDNGWRFHELVRKCCALLQPPANVNHFHANLQAVFDLSGSWGENYVYLRRCCQRLSVGQRPGHALAALVLFALLGPDGFMMLIPEEQDCVQFK